MAKLSDQVVDGRKITIPDVMLDNIMGVGHYNRGTWKQDLHNAFHYLSLRLDEHAQKEIRLATQPFAEFIKRVAPISYRAFEDYQMKSVIITDSEKLFIRRLMEAGLDEVPFAWYIDAGWTLNSKRDPTGFVRNREASELDEKVRIIFGKLNDKP